MKKQNPKNLPFYLLILDLNKVKLFEASRDNFNEISLNVIPRNLKEATGKDEFEKQLQSHSSSGISEKSGKRIFHGHGEGKDHNTDKIIHFFRIVDKGINKILPKDKFPLVIAGVDYLLPIYKKISNYPVLIEKGIIGSPERVDIKELHKKSLPIVASYYLKSEK